MSNLPVKHHSRLGRLFGALLKALGRLLVRIYYSPIRVTGRENLPGDGPVIFVANHQNSLLDPVMLGLASKRNLRFLAKAPLFEIPVLRTIFRVLGTIPVYRRSDEPKLTEKNFEMFEEVARLLTLGDSIGIFPEGKSHDRTGVEDLKTGVARISLRAVALGSTNLVICPVGINYEHKERFRSTVWIQIGKQINVPLADPESREVVRTLTEHVQKSLRELVIHLEDRDYEPVLGCLEEIVPRPAKRKRNAFDDLVRRREIADAINYFSAKDPERSEVLERGLLEHQKALRAQGITIHSDLFTLTGLRLVLQQTAEIVTAVLLFVPALLGIVFHAVPTTGAILATKRIKVEDRSEISFFRIIVGVPTFLIWYWIAWLWLKSYFVPWVAVSIIVAAPICGLFALAFSRALTKFILLCLSELRLFFRRERLVELRSQHLRISTELAELTKEFETARASRAAAAWDAGEDERRPLIPVLVVLLLVAIVGLSFTAPKTERWQETEERIGSSYELPDQARIAELGDDEISLANMITEVSALESGTLVVLEEFASGKRSFYHTEDDAYVRRLLLSFLNLRTEFLKLLWKYAPHERWPNENEQKRAFTISAGAAATAFNMSARFVALFQDIPDALKKLNEGEPSWGIPDGVYDEIAARVAAAHSEGRLKQFLDDYLAKERSPNAVVRAEIEKARESLLAEQKLAADGLTSEVISTLKTGVYQGQAIVSTLLSSAKIRRPRDGRPMITIDQLNVVRGELRPGDIILERQNWFLSRALMPGYWPHAALYVGTPAEIEAMGLQHDPRVAKHFATFRANDALGAPHSILEAVPEGTRFISLETCVAHADSVAVLRPRVSPEELREVIARAFSHLGKQYDFDFDFFTSDKVVCTELVYRALDPYVRFPLVEMYGRKTLPPTEIVRFYAEHRGDAEAPLEFRLFLDGDEDTGKATFGDSNSLADSVGRPSMTWFQ
ncbi:MAG: 1-acyl-sn-glycerol-3-phosphate acyltransferase [Deltaproteobacteria bacterium]|nr:1-acyl-sn-glycerol-3-phosphate acyltransferase [Deltaproteobacteria bacterium]